MLKKQKTNVRSQEIQGISGESLAFNVRLRDMAVCFFGFWWPLEVTEVLGEWRRWGESKTVES